MAVSNLVHGVSASSTGQCCTSKMLLIYLLSCPRVNHYLGTYDSEWDAASVYGEENFVTVPEYRTDEDLWSYIWIHPADRFATSLESAI